MCNCLLSTHGSAITAGVGKQFERDCPMCLEGQMAADEAHKMEVMA